MESLQQLETVILLLIAVLALAAIARKLVIPYPILLVIGGLVLGLIPGVPTLRLDPDVVFLVFLPPILWSAAYFTSWRDFRSNLRPITLLAVGLVLATTAAVAMGARIWLPGLGWAGAIALGAIVSPPDALSATAVAKRLGLPRRAGPILEGRRLRKHANGLYSDRSATGGTPGGPPIWNVCTAHAQRSPRERYRHRGTPDMGTAGRVDPETLEPLAAGARSNAGLVDSVYYRLDRHAGDRVSCGGISAAADNCSRNAVFLSSGNHPDHLFCDFRHVGFTGFVSSFSDQRLECKGRGDSGTRRDAGAGTCGDGRARTPG